MAFQQDHNLQPTPHAKNAGDVGTATIDAIAAELDGLGIGHW